MPRCNTEAMNLHLAEIAAQIAPGAHAALLVDQAGWHLSGRLVMPPNITLIPLPAKCPELNPQENVWQFLRDNWLSNRIFKSYDDVVDHCCGAWNNLVDRPGGSCPSAFLVGRWVLINEVLVYGSLWPLEDSDFRRRTALRRPVDCARGSSRKRADRPGDRFETYVRTQLVPTLQEGDIVILDNLPAHKSPAAERARRLAAVSAALQPRPQSHPEMAFANGNSRRICAPWPCAPSTNSGRPSDKSAISSPHRSVQTTSKPQDTDSNERPMLSRLFGQLSDP